MEKTIDVLEAELTPKSMILDEDTKRYCLEFSGKAGHDKEVELRDSNNMRYGRYEVRAAGQEYDWRTNRYGWHKTDSDPDTPEARLATKLMYTTRTLREIVDNNIRCILDSESVSGNTAGKF